MVFCAYNSNVRLTYCNFLDSRNNDLCALDQADPWNLADEAKAFINNLINVWFHSVIVARLSCY